MMIKPSFLEPEDRPTVIGRVFATPLVVHGRTGLPLLELLASGILAFVAGHERPDWTWRTRISAGVLTSMIMFASEWCHNLAHVAAANWIGKPTDAIRIFWGTPLLIYSDINDPAVSPRQHLFRALGGPFFNLLMLPFTWVAQKFTQARSFTRYLANFAFGVNAILPNLSLLPIPSLDGGALLKWSIVERGHTISEADKLVVGVNRYIGYALAAASGYALKKRRFWIGAVSVAFSLISFAIGFGLLKEHK